MFNIIKLLCVEKALRTTVTVPFVKTHLSPFDIFHSETLSSRFICILETNKRLTRSRYMYYISVVSFSFTQTYVCISVIFHFVLDKTKRVSLYNRPEQRYAYAHNEENLILTYRFCVKCVINR